jgi:hypothetical protein
MGTPHAIEDDLLEGRAEIAAHAVEDEGLCVASGHKLLQQWRGTCLDGLGHGLLLHDAGAWSFTLLPRDGNNF